MALAQGDATEARACFERAITLARLVDFAEVQANALAWLGAAHLALDEPQTASECTSKAVTLLERAGNSSGEYPAQEAWWQHYRALAAVQGAGEPASDGAWSALNTACQVMLAQIADLSDEGLRRNYLNRVEINREIVLEWTSQAARRGQSVAVFTQHEPARANLEQQFGRLLEIGRRLASQRDLDQLPDDILQAFVELCGAERCFLAARPGDSPDLRVLASTGVDIVETLMAEADPILDAALTSRFAVIRQSYW